MLYILSLSYKVSGCVHVGLQLSKSILEVSFLDIGITTHQGCIHVCICIDLQVMYVHITNILHFIYSSCFIME